MGDPGKPSDLIPLSNLRAARILWTSLSSHCSKRLNMSSQLEFTFPPRREIRSGSAFAGSNRRRLRMAAAAGICGIVGFGLFGQLAQNGRLDDEVRTLASQNAQLQRDISESQTEIVLAQTPAWLEEEARKLGYVLPGEKVYVLTTPGAAVPAKGGVTAPLPSFSPTLRATPTPSVAPSPSPSGPPTPRVFQLPTPSPHR